MTLDNRKILEIQDTYYRKLYTSEQIKIQKDYLDKIVVPQIEENEKILLDRPIEKPEILVAINKLKPNKAPGNDGLPVEFYKKFWGEIHGIIFQMYQEATDNEHGFTQNINRGIISLIEKEGRDQRYVENWRPLTLLNVDYKIFSKILASRLEKVLPQIIHTDQVGFIKGRSMFNNLLDLLSIIEYCNIKNIEALLMSFDIEKAFDKAEHEVLYKIMEKFNFGNNFISYMKALYKNCHSCTINHGYTKEYFSITRSLRQGCPLSAPAFLLLIEILSLKIRQNPNIKGITCGGEHKKLGNFADDLWTIIHATKQNYKNVLKEIDDFSMQTGLKINYNKSQVLRVGSMAKSNAKYYSENQLYWSDKTKILGIIVHNDMDAMIKENFEILLDKIKNVLNVWKARSLTLIGRVQIVNTLIASLMVQKLILLPIDVNDVFFQQVKTIITKFLWKDKKPKIKIETLFQTIPQGGLKLSNIELRNTAFKATWVTKLADKNKQFWKSVAWELLPINPITLAEANTHHKDMLQIKKHSKIWYAYLYAWSKWAFYTPSTGEECRQQVIHFNSNIKLPSGKTIFYPELVQKGIVHITDIIDYENKRFFTFQELQKIYPGIKNYIGYNAVLKAIPKNWIQKICKSENEALTQVEYVQNKTNRSQFLYNNLLQKQTNEDQARVKWAIEFNSEISKESWGKNHSYTYYLTLSTKLRWFQFRLLSNRIVTNVTRNMWDKEVNPQCTFCEQKKETIKHILYECKEVGKIWKLLKRWFKHFLGSIISITYQLVILNNYVGQYEECINTTILVFKQAIYAAKCQKQALNFKNIMHKVQLLQQDERAIAIKNNTLAKHVKKWSKMCEVSPY